jgi:penicillin-binding protein 1A
VQSIWGGEGVSVNDVNLENVLPLRYQERIANSIENLYNAAMAQKDPFSLYQYFNHHDYRIIVGLKYLTKLARTMGVYSKLEPVLSFGLGTNDVSAAEVAKVYQTFAAGKTYRFYKDGPDNQLNFIRRIEDREGNVIYEPEKKAFQLVDPCYAAQMGEILKKVVTHGTGRRARGELYLDYSDPSVLDKDGKPKENRVGVPAFGKTGTTNDYTTAYFAGFVPYPTTANEPLDFMNHQYVIASYVGFDLNKSMRRGGFRISGAMGALPIWTDYAKAMLKELNYKDFLDPKSEKMLGLQSWPTSIPPCTSPTAVDMPGGLVLQGGGDADTYQFTNFDKEGEVFQNEFARSSTVRSYVNLATVLSGGARTPRRAFQPFMKPDATQTGPKIIDGQGSPGSTQQNPAPVLPVMDTAAVEKKDGSAQTEKSGAPSGSVTRPAAKGEPEKKNDGKSEEGTGPQTDELW